MKIQQVVLVLLLCTLALAKSKTYLGKTHEKVTKELIKQMNAKVRSVDNEESTGADSTEGSDSKGGKSKGGKSNNKANADETAVLESNAKSAVGKVFLEEYDTDKLKTYIGDTYMNADGEQVTLEQLKEVKVIGLYVCDQSETKCELADVLLRDLYATVNKDVKNLEIIEMPVQVNTVESTDADSATTFAFLQKFALTLTDESALTERKMPWLSYGSNTNQILNTKATYQMSKTPGLYLLAYDGSLASSNGYEQMTSYGGVVSYAEWRVRVLDIRPPLEDADDEDEEDHWINNSGEDVCKDEWVGNGVCDPVCAVKIHQDGEDCLHLREGCTLDMLGDGNCDEICAYYRTHEDYNDCFATEEDE